LYLRKKLSAYGANKTKLKIGDIIWKINDQWIGPELKKVDDILNTDNTNSINIEIYRDGVKHKFKNDVYELSAERKLEFVEYNGTTFFGPTEKVKILTGKQDGIFIIDSEPGSPFSKIITANQNPGAICQIVCINGKAIKSFNDLKEAILSLSNKKAYKVEYILGNGAAESTVIKHEQQFSVKARLYKHNEQNGQWDVTEI
ncbi:MAG: S1C family serine protease, partial [Holosporales bacterium]|nr:S1C family serine protease [Holosporales bacterium]